MLVIRPIETADLESLLEISRQVGYGMTTLPPNRSVLSRRIEESRRSFTLHPDQPRGETYLFVMQENDSRRVVGVCGIISKVGEGDPFYGYRLRREPCVSEMLKVNKTISLLELTVLHDGPAVVGSLFLLPEFRKDGNGRFLALSRFVFMAQFPQRFAAHVIAEMRGVIDREGRSPFWDAVGRHFFELDFPQADYLTLVNKRFIADLMPKHPLYIPLLPAAAQAVIGKVHPETQPALKILQDEGFTFEDLVDIFEAGAVFGCDRARIRAVRESREALVAALAPMAIGTGQGEDCVVSNTDLVFRACKGGVRVLDDGRVCIDPSTARALRIEPGQAVRFVSVRPDRRTIGS